MRPPPVPIPPFPPPSPPRASLASLPRPSSDLARLKRKSRSKIFHLALNESKAYLETKAEPEGFGQPPRNARTGHGAPEEEADNEAMYGNFDPGNFNPPPLLLAVLLHGHEVR